MLPVHAVIDELRIALAQSRAAVLEAPPGAGKTTVVPLALLEESWLEGRKIVMLEPRRLAAKNAARFMAQLLQEKPGETVGYRVRLETCAGPKTRIEVVTEGVLTRMLQEDPALEDVGLVIFDEFHERNLQADLGLALTLDARANLREDLGLLVMSATLEGGRVATLLHGAPVVRTEGRQYPVETRYASVSSAVDIAVATAEAARELMLAEAGSALVFLPGAGEIRRAVEYLRDRLPAGIEVAPLFGDMPPKEQDVAIRPARDGRRKLVLATNIAESSLTIEGVRLVVDSGLERAPVFDPPSGMTSLVTRKISKASADQRRGRAGRNEPGICLRLWPEAQTARLQPQSSPEILAADLAPLVLELAGWGIAEPAQLRWLDPPPRAAFSQARELLHDLAALDGEGRITNEGKRMLGLPVHPRLAHMLLKGRDANLGGLACVLAALLEERDPLSGLRQSDIELRITALRSGENIPRGRRERLLDAARQVARRLKVDVAYVPVERIGWLIAQAYPDRVAQRRAGRDARYRMAGGRGAMLDRADRLSQSEWLAVAQVTGSGRDARIFLAAELHADDVAQLEREAGEEIRVEFDSASRAVLARRVRRVGSLVLEEHPVPVPPQKALPAALHGLRAHGLSLLPWSHETEMLRNRVEMLRRVAPHDWPACSDDALLASLHNWLAPFIEGVTRIDDISPHTLRQALEFHIGHARLRELDEQAPEQYEMPSGQRVRIDYSGNEPVLAARVQQFFGLRETPAIGSGRLPLLLHLLSPAKRPVQVTRDLASFWKNTYPDVRKDLRGRYPKHAWPEDPLTAEPRPLRRQPTR